MNKRHNICIAKQTLVMADPEGRALKSKIYDKFMQNGGTIVGNISVLNSYRFKNIDKEYYTVEDDCYLNYKKGYKYENTEVFPMEPMTMSKWCFNKYFVIVEGDGREEDE